MPQVTIDIGANDKASDVLSKVRQELDNAGSSTESMTGSFIKANMVLEGAKKGLELIKEATIGYTIECIKSYAELEQNQVALQAMTGSAVVAAQVVKELQGMSLNMPFQMQDVVGSSRVMVAMGESVSDLNKDMMMLGDIAAAVGMPIKTLAFDFGRMQTEGQATGRDLKMLAMQGVPIYEELGKILNVDTGAIRSMAAAGKVGFEDVKKAMQSMTAEGGHFHDMMKLQMETINGKITNLVDAWEILKISVGAGMEESAKRGIDAMAQTLKEGGLVHDFLRSLGDDVSVAVDVLASSLSYVDEQYRTLHGTAKDFHEALNGGMTIAKLESEVIRASLAVVTLGVSEFFARQQKDIRETADDYQKYLDMGLKGRVELETYNNAYDDRESARLKTSIDAVKEKSKYDAEAKKQYEELRKEAEKYFDTVVEKAELAGASELDKINITTKAQLEKIDKLSAYEKDKDLVQQAWFAVLDSEKRQKMELEVKMEADKYAKFGKLQASFYASSVSNSSNALAAESNAIVGAISGMSKVYADNLKEVAKRIKETGGDSAMSFKESFKLAADVTSVALGAVSQILGAMSQLVQQNAQVEIDTLKQTEEVRIKHFDDAFVLAQDDQSSIDLLNQQKLEAYAATLDGMSTEDAARAMKQKAVEMGSANNSKMMDEAKAAYKAAQDKKTALATYQVTLSAFNTKKDLDMAQVITADAIGIANAWSASLAFGPMGPAIAAGLTALMVGVGAEQISLISSQKPPAPPMFWSGVENFEGGLAMVGERGRELVHLPSGSSVKSNSETESIMGGATIVQNNIYLDSVIIHQSLVDSRRASAYGGY